MIDNPYVGMGGGEPSQGAIVAVMSRAPAEPARVALVPNTVTLNPNAMTWRARRARAALTFHAIGYSGAPSATSIASEYDWVVLKTGDQGYFIDLAAQLDHQVRHTPDRFRLVAEFPMADGGIASVFEVIDVPLLADETVLRAVVEGTEPGLRDVTFGHRFRLLGVTLDRAVMQPDGSQVAVLRLAWEAVAAGPLDRLVAVHFVDETGVILSGADYPQHIRRLHVNRGTRWIDERRIPQSQLTGVTGLGFCLYHQTEPRLLADRGPRDWADERVRIPLSALRSGR